MTGTGLACELVTDFARLEALAPQWQRLYAEAAPEGGVFQSWGWTRAYWTAHGHEVALLAPVVFAGTRLAGVLPLARRGHRLEPLGAGYSDYNGLLCRREDADAVGLAAIDALMEAPADWTQCVLEGVPESSPLIQRASSLPARLRAHRQVVFGSLCPAMVDDTGDIFDRMSRKDSLRRHERKLGRRGELRFTHLEDRAAILDRLDEFLRFHVARHALTGTRSTLSAPAARAMLAAAVSELDPARELRFSVLELQGRPVAYHFGFQDAGRFTYYIPAFDVDFWDDGPGEVMLRRLLQYAREQALREFDFTIGDEHYKERFATHVRRTFTIHLYRHPRRPRALVLRAGRAVRDAARRRPGVVARVRPLIRRARRAAERVRALGSPRYRAALWARAFGRTEATVAHRDGRPAQACDAIATRVGLTDLVWSQIRDGWAIDEHALDSVRDWLSHGDAIYLASQGAERCVFRVSRDAGAATRGGGEERVLVAEAPASSRCSRPAFAALLGATLGALDRPAHVCVVARRHRNAALALRRCGYAFEEP